jgi:hypothetical protein
MRAVRYWMVLSGVSAAAIILLGGAGRCLRGPQAYVRHSERNSPSRARIVTGDHAARLAGAYARLPLSFEPNLGQSDSAVRFVSHGPGYSLLVLPNEAVLVARPPARGQSAATLADRQCEKPADMLRFRFVGARSDAAITGEDELEGKSNYLIGNDPAKWQTNIPTYGRVHVAGLYAGVDAEFYGNPQTLEYDLRLAPGARPENVQLDFPGTQKLWQDSAGNVLIQAGRSEFSLRKPFAYQIEAGHKKEVAAWYETRPGRRVRFVVGKYDAAKPLVIDPALQYSTYLGSSGDDQGFAIAVDESGNAYVTGATSSPLFPYKNGFQENYGGGLQNAFVTKIKTNGTSIVYSTFLGGNISDAGLAIAVNGPGNAFVAGSTASPNFPTENPIQAALAGVQNAFITELNPQGSSLVYSTFLGGDGVDSATGIALDPTGNVYIAGATTSSNFPTVSAFQSALAGTQNAFVAELNSIGSMLSFSTYLGGNQSDSGSGIALDGSGNAYITGTTTSTNFPTAAAYQPQLAGASDVFVTEMKSDGSGLLYSTYLGGGDSDVGGGIAVDTSGNAYVAGGTSSSNFPVVNAFQATLASASDAFVTKLNAGGASLAYSTYLGGTSGDQAYAAAVDSSGNVYVTGQTRSADFPTENAFQPSLAGTANAFITSFSSSGALVFSTFLGGSGPDIGSGITVDSSADVYVTGSTDSSNFLVVNAFDGIYNGDGDAFVAEVSSAPTSGLLFTPNTLDFGTVMQETTSPPMTVMLTSTGNSTLAISSINVMGTNNNMFAESNNCPGSLANGSSCTLTVTFTPTTSGTLAATISVNTNAPGSPQIVNISGTGMITTPQVSLSPSTVTFSGQPVGGSSLPQTVTLVNNGSGPLTITTVAIGGGNHGDFSETNNCGTTVQANGTCAISVVFTPSAGGTRTAILTVTDNATPTTQSVALVGGEDFALFSAPALETVTAGQPTTFTITAEPLLEFNQTITFSCNKPPAGVTCLFTPATLTLDGTDEATTTLTVMTTARTMAPPWPGGRWGRPWLIWMGGAMLCLFLMALLTGGRGRVRLALGACVLLACIAAGCGGGSGTVGTPAGTYSIGVDGTVGTLVESTTVNLIVN